MAQPSTRTTPSTRLAESRWPNGVPGGGPEVHPPAPTSTTPAVKRVATTRTVRLIRDLLTWWGPPPAPASPTPPFPAGRSIAGHRHRQDLDREMVVIRPF